MTILLEVKYSSGIYLFKVNNGNTKTMREICSKLTIKTPEPRPGIFIVHFDQISYIVLLFPLFTLNEPNILSTPDQEKIELRVFHFLESRFH